MKDLTKQEQEQLDALLAKKKAAEEISKEVKEAIASIEDSQTSLQRDVADQYAKNEMVKTAYDKLSEGNDLFKLVDSKRTVMSNVWYSWDKYTDEVKAEAFTILNTPPCERYSEDVPVQSISVNNYNIGVSVEPARRKRHGPNTHKVQMQLFGQDVSYAGDRWINLHSTIVAKVKERIERLEYEKSAANKSQILKADAITYLSRTFPKAKVEYNQEWKSGYGGRGGRGYSVDRINVTFDDGLVAEFSYQRKDKLLVEVNLEKVNFNILAAIKEGNASITDTVKELRNLKGNFKK